MNRRPAGTQITLLCAADGLPGLDPNRPEVATHAFSLAVCITLRDALPTLASRPQAAV